jgi:pre-mRNA-splicing factor ATP-dependent RNA helicase DHX16
MASDRELRAWVGDRLHDVAGFSDRTTADFIVATAKKAKAGPAALARSLAAAGLPDTPAVAAFCGELLSRLPSSSGGGGSRHAAVAAQARALIKKGRTLGLLEDEEDDAREAEAARARSEAAAAEADGRERERGGKGRGEREKGRERQEKHLRKSKAAAAGDDEDDPTVVRRGRGSKRRWEEDEDGGGGARGREDEEAVAAARREAELEADQREKEEFEQRWVGPGVGACLQPARTARPGGGGSARRCGLWGSPRGDGRSRRGAPLLHPPAPRTPLSPFPHLPARLRERDEAKTKKVAEEEPRESKKDRERRAAAALGAEDRAAMIPLLRDVSRQEYLAKREADKLAALEDEIRDEEFLFAGGRRGGGGGRGFGGRRQRW